MSTLGKRLLLGGAALVAASLSVLWWAERSTDEPSAALRETSSVSLQWRVGSSQRYDVRVDSSMQISPSAANAAQNLNVRVNGTLDWLTLEAAPDTASVGLRLSLVELRVAGSSDEATNRALTAPFRVRFATTGLPEAFEFPADVSAENRLILENLVRMFQVTMQSGDDWVAQESNAAGSYEAVYRRTTPSRVEKTKRDFVGDPSAPIYAGADIASSEVFSTDAAYDWLAGMTIEETIRTQGRGAPALEITNHATLELRPAAQAAATADTWTFAAAPAPPAGAATQPTVPNLLPEEAQRQIVAQVEALDSAVEGRTSIIHRLRDLLRVDAGLPAAVLALMQTESLTDRTRADLYLAFELAGTEPAQAALTSVIGNPAWSIRDSMRAIVALGGVAQPSPDTIEALWLTAQGSPSTDDGRQLASTATFALGSLGNTLNTAQDPDYSLLRSRLLGGALGGGSIEERANFVRAIGNTRDASLTGNVVVMLDDPSPEVRRAAALSLGLLDTNQAAAQLISRFDRERDSEVRGAIAESLVNWTAPTASAMATIRAGLGTELDENTRYNMAHFLSQNLREFPENRSVLQALLRTEPSRRIRQSVAEALTTPTPE